MGTFSGGGWPECKARVDAWDRPPAVYDILPVMILLTLVLALLDGMPYHTSLEDCRAVVETVHRRCPPLRSITGPLVFDLRVEPRIHFGMTRRQLENLVGFTNGMETDFSYPVKFTHSFEPLPWLTRSSRHQVEFDTNWLTSDGGLGHIYRWREERGYWLTGFGRSVEFLRIDSRHFGAAGYPDSSKGCPYPAAAVDASGGANHRALREEVKNEYEARKQEETRWRERAKALHHDWPADTRSCCDDPRTQD